MAGIRVLWVAVEPTDYLRDELKELNSTGVVSVIPVYLAEQLSQSWEQVETDWVLSRRRGRLPTGSDIFRFLSDLLETQIDVALLEGYSPWQMVFIAAALRSKGIPFVMRSDTPSSGRRRPIHRQLVLRWMVQSASWCLPGGTPQLKNLLQAGANERRTSIGYMGIDNRKFAGKERDFHEGKLKLVGVGRLVERKGWLTAARTVRQLAEQGHQIQLEILGDGPVRSQLEDLAAGSRSISVVGAVRQDELIRRLGRAHVFILPAVDEPWGLVVNEALASGLPVVVGKDVGCVQDLVQNGVNGLLVDPLDEDSIRRSLLYLLSRPEEVRRMSREALRSTENWSAHLRLDATVGALVGARKSQ